MKFHVLIAALVFGLALGTAPSLPAQEARHLAEDEVEDLLNESEDHLEAARRAARQGNSQEANQHLDNYTRNLTTVNRALANDRVEGEDLLEVAELVDEATLRHVPVLQDVLTRVPAEAQPAIQRALEVSLIGHDVATQAVVGNTQVSIPGFLTLGTAERALTKNEALLEHAQRSQQLAQVLQDVRARVPEQALRGIDTAIANALQRNDEGLQTAINRHAVNMNEITRAIETGRVPDFHAQSVLDLVDRSTRRQLPVLESLLGQVPEQARPNIERAIQVSQRGNQAATAALRRTPAGGVRPGSPGGAPGGRPSGAPGGGPPGGGPPSGGPPGGGPPGGGPPR